MVHVVSKLDIPEAVTDEYRAGERKKGRRGERRTFVVNVLTLLAVVAATVFTGLSLLLTRDALRHAIKSSADADKDIKMALGTADRFASSTEKLAGAAQKSAEATLAANEANRDQFRQDQRPYLWLVQEVEQPGYIVLKGSAGGRVYWNIRHTNYGRSPAYKVRMTADIQTGENALGRKRSYVAAKGAAFSAPMPPTKITFKTALSPDLITSEAWTRLQEAENAIVAFGRIDYTDGYGKEYVTTFCVFRLNLGGIAYCPGENDIR